MMRALILFALLGMCARAADQPVDTPPLPDAAACAAQGGAVQMRAGAAGDLPWCVMGDGRSLPMAAPAP